MNVQDSRKRVQSFVYLAPLFGVDAWRGLDVKFYEQHALLLAV